VTSHPKDHRQPQKTLLHSPCASHPKPARTV
jgi:hypothetical protein